MLTAHIIATKYDNDKLESPGFHYYPKVVKVAFSGLPLLLTLPSGPVSVAIILFLIS